MVHFVYKRLLLSKRPTVSLKFLVLVHSRPPHLPFLVFASIGEDNNIRLSEVSEKCDDLRIGENE